MARQALQGRCPLNDHTFRDTDLIGMGLSKYHPALFAAYRWLAALFENADAASETSILSVSGLSSGATETDKLQLALINGQPVSCQMSARRIGKGAGGRRVKDALHDSVISKKGPDSWSMSAQVWKAVIRKVGCCAAP